ncbi:MULTISPECIES: uracil-DNA glycosylase family protein [unclassified Sphingopyxis]|jgi:DNA polymerase|uniref:uracil-DNA glycosylase family protein n=1 Tax=unclassified Sphingopyxis TaxID=2614943 RepID=UPI0006C3ED35|nr:MULTISPECIES: uracil-DNA glycosylase family protein [unclassified Sphingopyxis]USI79000.1 uracil-DNA glycosylase [Sphingopyxis sp. USTB-05]GAO78539.1 uracil-DNA glycosylase, family 4 [Sphingopyxis sp. C-1]
MGGQNSALLAESICDWWSLAGVDALVGEQPAGWLVTPPANDAAAAKPKRVVQAEPELPPLPPALQRQDAAEDAEPKGPVVFPDDWTEFRNWLAESDDVPGSQWDAHRVLPVGDAGAPLMLLTAWPEIDDQQGGTLFSGAAGKLLDAMLQAIGMARSDCYVASLAVTRPAGGRCDGEEAAELDRLLWHHLRLAKPGRLLLIGSDIVRMAAATALPDARGRLLNINQDGGNLEAVAVAHPTMLLARPAQKAAAWDSLKLFNRGR